MTTWQPTFSERLEQKKVDVNQSFQFPDNDTARAKLLLLRLFRLSVENEREQAQLE